MRFSAPTPIRLARAAGVLAAAYFVFWACAPPTAMPPPVPMADATWEAGLAAVETTEWYGERVCEPLPEPDTGLSNDCEVIREAPNFSVDSHAWGHRALGDRWLLGATAFLGGSVMGGGLYTRVQLNDNPNVYIGAQLDGGFAWGRLGVPMSVRVGPDFWLYTKPTIELSQYSNLQLPLGASTPFGNGWHVNVEANGRLNPVTPYIGNYSYSAGPALRFALGASKRW